jgi:hypothetical protein
VNEPFTLLKKLRLDVRVRWTELSENAGIVSNMDVDPVRPCEQLIVDDWEAATVSVKTTGGVKGKEGQGSSTGQSR